MKKISEFNWQETKRFILTLKSQLALITSDEDLKAAAKAVMAAKNGKEADMTYLDIAYTIVDSLLATNEMAIDTIIAACLQIPVDELQTTNNIDIIETVIDFFSVEKYRKLLSSAIKSGIEER